MKSTFSQNFLRNYTVPELKEQIIALGYPAFRAQQLFQAIYSDKMRPLSEIAALPADLRGLLADKFALPALTLATTRHSEDGTIKFLFKLADGKLVESVLIPSEMLTDEGDPKRQTICVSTQVGCPLGCKFCATASLKVKRNLETAEIVEQLLSVRSFSGKKISNLVFMGMGEPMLNYDNVMRSVEIFTSPEADLLSPRRITLSTAGVIPGIIRMANENCPIKLAISLHATTQELRLKLMPIAKKYPLNELLAAAEYYYRATRKTVTFEYILFDGLNDSENDARRLAKISRRFRSKINVIPFHNIEFTHPEGLSAELHPATPEKFNRFITQLKNFGAVVMTRSSSGKDIEAACGQLALSSAPVFSAGKGGIKAAD
ncbi:23S rRNA (adenine(2503)-C(2))-methyltransferase RlmN [Ignavibacteria bacterium]|nr:23S rRNA (adenine(2503)-C(2))-methyltransferase RlmN [Bacteroidota bacterium]MCZ2132680.1 23S rRNA (adenine(2503)-C(2))-methyltransferase RlmN [Bacteroidota bacterium]